MYFASCCKSRVYFLPASCLIFLLSLSLSLSVSCLSSQFLNQLLVLLCSVLLIYFFLTFEYATLAETRLMWKLGTSWLTCEQRIKQGAGA